MGGDDGRIEGNVRGVRRADLQVRRRDAASRAACGHLLRAHGKAKGESGEVGGGGVLHEVTGGEACPPHRTSNASTTTYPWVLTTSILIVCGPYGSPSFLNTVIWYPSTG